MIAWTAGFVDVISELKVVDEFELSLKQLHCLLISRSYTQVSSEPLFCVTNLMPDSSSGLRVLAGDNRTTHKKDAGY